MRPILHGDVSMAARALMQLPDPVRPLRIARLLREAEAADLHRKSTGRAHPVWGNGSLVAAAARFPRAQEPDFDDPEYCRCWMTVFDALLAHRGRS